MDKQFHDQANPFSLFSWFQVLNLLCASFHLNSQVKIQEKEVSSTAHIAAI